MRKGKRKAIEKRVKSAVESIHTIDETHFKSAVFIDHFYRPDHYTVMFVEKGELDINYNNEDIRLVGPAVIFTVPDSQFILKGRNDDISIISLLYSPEFLSETGFQITGSGARKFLTSGLPTYAHLDENQTSCVKKLLQVLHFHINNPDPHDYHKGVIHNCFTALILEIGAIFTRDTPAEHVRLSRKEALSLEFAELLNLHYYKERSVSFYAEKLNVTARHLTFTTKAVFGKSAGEMIDEKVLNEAKNLLLNPQYNISQIADALNFSNPSFFGKFFKKQTGKSPKDFRITLV